MNRTSQNAPDGQTPDEAEKQQLQVPRLLISLARLIIVVLYLPRWIGIGATIISVLAALRESWWIGLLVGVGFVIVSVVLAWRFWKPPWVMPGVTLKMEPPQGSLVAHGNAIDEIVEALDDRTVKQLAVVGRRGVGTSTCMSAAYERWVSGLGPSADDPQVYLPVRSGQGAASARQVLITLALVLQVKLWKVLGPLDSAAEAIRTELSEQEKLLILDNVDNADIIRHLSPRGDRNYRLLTTGSVPEELADNSALGQRTVALHQLDASIAIQVLGDAVGLGDERPPELAELATRCGYQPGVLKAAGSLLANGYYTCNGLLTVLGEIAEAPPHCSEPLRNEARERLGSLANAHVALNGLPRRSRRLLRRLALAPSTSPSPPPLLDRPTLESLRALPRLRRAGALRQLVDCQFLSVADNEYSIRPEFITLAKIHFLLGESRRSGRRSHTRFLKHLATQAGKRAEKREPANQEWFRQHHDLLRTAVTIAAIRVGGTRHALPRRTRRWWFRLAVQLCVWYAAEDLADRWRTTCKAIEETPSLPLQLLPSGRMKEMWLYNELAAIERRHGSPQSGLQTLQAAVSARPRWRHVGNAQLLTNRGILELCRGDASTAITTLHEADRHRSRRDRIGQALTDLALGLAHYDYARADPDDRATRNLHLADARNRLRKACDRFATEGEVQGEMAALTNLVLVLGEMEDPGTARSHFETAMERYRTEATLPRLTNQAGLRLNYAAVLLKHGTDSDVSKAREHLSKAIDELSSSSSRQDRQILARALLYWGDVEQHDGVPGNAPHYWRKASTIAEQIGDSECLGALDTRL